MTSTPVRFIKKAAICGILCFSLSGCAGTIIAGLTISELLTAGSIGSALITGKGLGEHAMDIVTGQDCRILEAVFRKDRAICEPKNSPATEDDFGGLVALLDTPAGEEIRLAEIPNGKNQFPNVNLQAKANANRVLATLTGGSMQQASLPLQNNPARLSSLTKATEKFDPVAIKVNAVASQDLRKRLTGSSL